MLATCFKPSPLPTDSVLVGHVLGAWGLRGAVKVAPYSEAAQALLSCQDWYLLLPPAVIAVGTALGEPPTLQAKRGKTTPITPQPLTETVLGVNLEANGGAVICQVRKAHFHGRTLVAWFKGLTDCDLAQHLKGAPIYIPRQDFPVPAKDEYYWVDLIGLSVYNREGLCLGEVKDLLTTGPQAVLVVEPGENAQLTEENKLSLTRATPSRKEVLIPFVSVYIDKVDLAAKRIYVDWHADD